MFHIVLIVFCIYIYKINKFFKRELGYTVQYKQPQEADPHHLDANSVRQTDVALAPTTFLGFI
jgi:hypothetical protein